MKGRRSEEVRYYIMVDDKIVWRGWRLSTARKLRDSFLSSGVKARVYKTTLTIE